MYCRPITLYFRGRKISRKVNLKYFREKIFSRITYCSRENIFPRKYLPAKISSRENIFSRKYPLAKISTRENILPRKSFACFVIVASFSLFAARLSGTPVAGITLDLEFASDRRNNGIIPTISNLDRSYRPI